MFGEVEYKIKDDWRSKGDSKNSAIAEWMNGVAYQLNNAEVITGGTCKPTEFGLRIETDSTYPRSFEVVKTGDDGGAGDWSVRAGIAVDNAGREYWNANGKSPYTLVAMGDIPADPTDFEVFARIDKTTEGIGRILFTTLDGVSTESLQYVKLAEVVDDAVTQLQVGNIFMGERLDILSLDWNVDQDTQIFNWDGAAGSTPAAADLIPYQDVSAARALKYSTPADIAAQINWDTVDWEAFWDGLGWDDAGSQKIPHTKLDFTGSTTETALQNADHDQRHAVRGATYTSWAAQSIGYGAGDNPSGPTASILQIDLLNGRLKDATGANTHADWHTGELFATDGTTSHLDWLNRELDKVWTGTDTTTASILGTGALVLGGGMYAAKGVAASGGASWAGGIFQNGDFQVALASTTLAASFVNGLITSAAMATATHALSGTGRIETDAASDYWRGGEQGVSGGGFAGGIKTDEAAANAVVVGIVEMYF